MAYKRFSILFLLIAQIVILGHGMIAHHHFVEAAHLENDHQLDGTEPKDDLPDNFLDVIFGGFTHIGNQVVFTNFGSSEIEVQQEAPQDLKKTLVEYTNKHSSQLNIGFNKQVIYAAQHIIYSAPAHTPYSLRGPPVYMAA